MKDADDQVIRQRINGCSVRTIAKARCYSVAEINAAIDRWADPTITHKIRKNLLAFEFARLDELHEVFYPRSGR